MVSPSMLHVAVCACLLASSLLHATNSFLFGSTRTSHDEPLYEYVSYSSISFRPPCNPFFCLASISKDLAWRGCSMPEWTITWIGEIFLTNKVCGVQQMKKRTAVKTERPPSWILKRISCLHASLALNSSSCPAALLKMFWTLMHVS